VEEAPAEDSAEAAAAVSSQVCVHRILPIGILIQNRCEIWCELPLTDGISFGHRQLFKNLRLACESLPAVSSSQNQSRAERPPALPSIAQIRLAAPILTPLKSTLAKVYENK